MDAITVRNLTKRFGDVTAVDDLSFDVTRGNVTGFVGPNGSGKTTTLRAILGLASVDRGTAVIDGRPYIELDRPITHVGAVLEPSFHPGRTGHDHLRIVAAAAGLTGSRLGEVLEQVGLAGAAHRRVGGYSMGMRQRLGLASALVGRPSVLILDEPTNGLDPEGVHWLRGFLRAHADEGGTVLVSSHLLAELALSADHIVVIKSGRLVAEGSIEDLTSQLATGVHIRTPDAANLLTVLTARGVPARRVGPDEIVAETSSTDLVGSAIAESGTVVYEVRLERPNLEDTFLSLTAVGDER
ncbi:MAG TPA: ATP-binding cassette domain-containing protein [Euzebyales bacterium]|nr:ATP-binding cassette domain-containing protein [Euzebyales bacterium]